MSNITNVQQTNGITTYWQEGEEQYYVVLTPTGKPSKVTCKQGKWVDQEITFNYTSTGEFLGLSGNLDSLLLPSLIDQARGVVSYVTNPLTGGIGNLTAAGRDVMSDWGIVGPNVVINSDLLQSAPYRLLLANGRAGVATPVLMIGDSIGFGYGSTTANAGMRTNGFGPQLARALSGKGIRAQYQGFLGNGLLHGVSTESRLYDGRLSASGGGQGINSLGGASLAFTGAGNGTLTYTPSTPVDALSIYCYQFGGAGNISYQIDGSAAVSFSLNNTNGLYVSAPISLTTLASHTISMTYVSGAGGYLLGLNAYDGAIGGLQIINAANNGGFLADYTPSANAYDALSIGLALSPAATIIVIGANHWNSAGSVATFTADLQTLITAYATKGPVILVSDNPSNPSIGGNATIASQLTYVNAMRSLAVSNSLLMFDFWTYFGGGSTNFAALTMVDGIHPKPAGYGMGAGLMARALALA